jgi:hypothetical protein
MRRRRTPYISGADMGSLVSYCRLSFYRHQQRLLCYPFRCEMAFTSMDDQVDS